MANTSILAAFERMWQHVVLALNGKSDSNHTHLQPDWNQNNETADDYVKNRPFYSENPIETILIDNATVNITDEYGMGKPVATNPFSLELIEGNVYIVSWDGTQYTVTCTNYADADIVYIGNLYEYTGSSDDDTGEPFLIYAQGTDGIAIFADAMKTVTVSITSLITTVHQIEEKYLPPNALIGYIGTGTFSEVFNSRSNIASGDWSHAEGRGTIASDHCSHAEGYYSHAEGYSSHAEGESDAIGGSSHAEGNYTTAIGYASHSEGGSNSKASEYNITKDSTIDDVLNTVDDSNYGPYFSLAFGDWSHVEGKDNIAIGDKSHVEGSSNIAIGNNSHVEGYGNKANGEYQHVQGKCNIEDTSNKYAHIVGNGDLTTRSNAHTLDWNGNAWFAGDVTVGADNKKLATEESVTAISNLVGDTAVATQINTAVSTHTNNTSNPHGVTLAQLGVTATAAEVNYIDGVTSNVQTQLDKKLNDYTIDLYNGTGGNPKAVKFLTINYSNCDSNNGVSAKVGMLSGHGNGTSYVFLQDAIINVNYTGTVTVDNFKYYGQAVTDDNIARQYGDIFWVIDTTNKIVDFYCLMGQYAHMYQMPWKRLTASSGGTVTQHTTCTVYSSGTKVWANNSDIALMSDVSTLSSEITDKLNRSTAVDVADTNYTTLMARGTSLNSAETTPAVNGAIAWTYE